MGGWVLTTPVLKSSLGKNDVTGHVMTQSKYYPCKVVMNVVLMFGSSFLSFQVAQAKVNIVDYLMWKNVSCTEVKKVNKKRKNDAIRKKLKKNPMKYEQCNLNEQYHKLQNKENKAVELEGAGQCSLSPDSSFSNKHHILSRDDKHLPKSTHKKAEIIEKSVEKYQVKIPLQYKTWQTSERFLQGRKDHVYVGKMTNVAISNVCIYCRTYANFWIL